MSDYNVSEGIFDFKNNLKSVTSFLGMDRGDHSSVFTNTGGNLLEAFEELQSDGHIDSSIDIQNFFIKSFIDLDVNVLKSVTIENTENTQAFLTQWEKAMKKIGKIYEEGRGIISGLYEYYAINMPSRDTDEDLIGILNTLEIEMSPKKEIVDWVMQDIAYNVWEKKLSQCL